MKREKKLIKLIKNKMIISIVNYCLFIKPIVKNKQTKQIWN